MTAWAQGNVVVLGANGMLAQALIPPLRSRTADAGGAVLAWKHSDLDITNRQDVLEKIKRAAPTVVINCAAYTDVDGCESNVERAMAVNADGPANLAGACKESSALCVQYSTDFVFNGLSERPYTISDTPSPLSAYGKSKFLGVQAVCTSGCRHLVIGTSWLYGTGGRNFVDAILAKAVGGERLRVVADQVGRPTYTVDLAEATIHLLDAGARGMLHFANAGHCSWYEFAEEILRRSGRSTPIERITSRELVRPALRPAYSVLDLSEYAAITGKSPRHWKPALADYLHLRRLGGQVA